MTVYLNPRSAPQVFHHKRSFADQEAYDRVADVKIEVYEAVLTVIETTADLTTVKMRLQERLSDIYAGKVDA